jgi:hypothetical protein
MTGWPTPGGTVVRAVHPELGCPMRASCKGHLYITMNSAVPVDHNRSECRYVQAAECLVCGYVAPQLDADFFTAATDDDIDDCLAMIQRMMEDLRARYQKISGLKFYGEKFLLPADL